MPPQLAFRIWPLVKDRLGEVLAKYPSDTSLAAIENDVMCGLQLLWIAIDAHSQIIAAATTAICVTPSRKFCLMTCAHAVNAGLYEKFFALVENYARAEGCASLRLYGRKGWARVLKDFAQPWIVLDKELT